MWNSLCKHIQSTRLVPISLSHPVPSSAVILISSAAARDRAFLALLVFVSLESSQSHCHSLKGLPLMCKGVRIPQVAHLRPRAPAFGARRWWRISVIRHCHLVDFFSITGSAEKKNSNSFLFLLFNPPPFLAPPPVHLIFYHAYHCRDPLMWLHLIKSPCLLLYAWIHIKCLNNIPAFIKYTSPFILLIKWTIIYVIMRLSTCVSVTIFFWVGKEILQYWNTSTKVYVYFCVSQFVTTFLHVLLISRCIGCTFPLTDCQIPTNGADDMTNLYE